ncbi:MAG: FG-GAP-like repeat-containing protein, partial [Gallionella sp.]
KSLFASCCLRAVVNGGILSAELFLLGINQRFPSIASSAPVPATFEGTSAVSTTNTTIIDFTNCNPTHTSSNANDFYDSNYDPLGTIDSSGEYGVYLTPLSIPFSVKVGDTGSIGIKNKYTDSTKVSFSGRDVISYLIEPDTANTAIVNVINKSYDVSGILISTEQDRSRILANGIMISVSADIQFANGSTTHFVLTALPDTSPPSVVSTSPPNNSSTASPITAITATFSEAMNPATLTTIEFTLMNGASPVAGTVAFSGITATFTPAAPLYNGVLYTATITTGVKDLSGNQLVSNYSWSFAPGLFRSFDVTPTGSFPEAVVIGDVNGDGRNDVVMTTSFYFDPANDYKIFIFLQNANGGLNPPIKYATNSTNACRDTTVAIGDINHDGKNDVIIGDSNCGIEVFTQNTLGGLDPAVFYPSADSNKIRIADLNHDGLQDGLAPNTISVWLQNIGGTLDTPIVYSVDHSGFVNLETGDVNNDGLVDIVFLSTFGANLGVLTQNQNGTLNFPVYYDLGSWEYLPSAPLIRMLVSPPSSLAVGDINGDGENDVVVTLGGNNPGAKIGTFLQNGRGTLDPIVNYASYDIPSQIEIFDVTGDGRKDVAIFHDGWDALGVYLQQANGLLSNEHLVRFPQGSTPMSNNNPQSMAVGDINGDGTNDVVFADNNFGLISIYHY